MKLFAIGDRVVLTAEALTLMGAIRSSEITRTWSIMECFCKLCHSGRFLCTDQRAANDNGWRHIASENLRLEGQPTMPEMLPAHDNGVSR